jgi:hypothetical protein
MIRSYRQSGFIAIILIRLLEKDGWDLGRRVAAGKAAQNAKHRMMIR